AVDDLDNSDPADDVILAGAQDNGISLRDPVTEAWSEVTGGDGTSVQVGYGNGVPTRRYWAYGTGFYLFRQDGGGAAPKFANRTIANAGVPAGTILDKTFDPTIPFSVPFAVNALDPLRLLVGTRQRLYESSDGGDTFNALGGFTTVRGVPKADRVAGLSGMVSAVAYGGMDNTVNPPAPKQDVAYVGTESGEIYLRSPGAPAATFTRTKFREAVRAATGRRETPLQIILDPDNWRVAYVVTR